MANFAPPANLLWDTSPVADRDPRADFDARSANCDRLANGDFFAHHQSNANAFASAASDIHIT